MGMHGDDVDFGNTLAGWAGTAVGFTGFLVAGGSMVAAAPAGFWAGLGLAAGGGLVGLGLRRCGWGKPDGPRPASLRHWRAGRAAHLAARRAAAPGVLPATARAPLAAPGPGVRPGSAPRPAVRGWGPRAGAARTTVAEEDTGGAQRVPGGDRAR